jgi:opacity protein-like surface antigen
MRLVLCVLVAALVGQPALADEYWYGQPDWRLTFRPYVGAGISYVHHTGHDLDTPLKAENWEIGGKAFGGIEITRQLNVEVGFHYLNQTQLLPALQPWTENSYAATASLLLFTPPFFWPSPAYPYRWFFRAGGVYKHISDNNPFIGPNAEVENGFGLLIGAGVEVEFSKVWFGRLEYEYLAKVGTTQAINVQHTPISASFGAKF